MRISMQYTVGLLCWIVAAASGTAADAHLDAVLSQLPAQDAAHANSLNAKLIDMGPEAVESVCAMLAPKGDDDAAKARYAISGLVKYASEQGRSNASCAVSKALLSALEDARELEVQAFLIEQLTLIAGDEAVAPLTAYLTHEELCDPAAAILRTIGSERAAKALANALPGAEGKPRLALVKALGELRYAPAAEAIRPLAASEDTALRRTALYAVANIPDPDAQDLLSASFTSSGPYEMHLIDANHLLWIRRMAEAGEKRTARKACIELIDTRTGPEDANVRSAALHELAAIRGRRARPEILDAVLSGNRVYRAAALPLLQQHASGPRTTRKLARLAEEACPETRADLIAALGERGDKAALPAVLDALNDHAAPVRLSAIDAAVNLNNGEIVDNLLAMLEVADAAGETVTAVKQALLRLPASQVVPAIAAALAMPEPATPGETARATALPSAAQVTLIEVLAARQARDQRELLLAYAKQGDEAVRIAAIKALGAVAGEEDLPQLVHLLVNAQTEPEQQAAQEVVKTVAAAITDPSKRRESLAAALDKCQGAARDLIATTLAVIDATPVAVPKGFRPLFNGEDLSGWVGDTDGYKVEDGLLVCDPGGNIYTEEEFGDFVLRFEFKLVPAGNNGLAVRAPIGGGAYNGMELQILDNTAEVYANLQPYQYHGSVYGVVPAKRGHMRPVGEWNFQEVIARGTRITVNLNGATIVDADLKKASTPETMDHKEHVGLLNESGHLGFLGHGSPVAFRNIHIKTLNK